MSINSLYSFLDANSSLSTPNSSLFLMIGLPGSGKSTLAKQLLVEYPLMKLISTDVIRGKLYGDEGIQGHWMPIWRTVLGQFQETVNTNNHAIYDATNTQRRQRREIIAIAREIGFSQITGIWVRTPVWLCLARNNQRQRQVPEEIIFRMHRQLRDAPPSLVEGLDNLVCYR